MTDFIDATEELVDQAHSAANRDGIDRLKAENQVISAACETVADLSESGEISEGQMNALADQLADILARYNKTDIKGEFNEYFTESSGEGTPFDQLLSDRLESIQTVSSTDAKQGTVWRWHFSDGVKLETQTSKDGGRKHYDWNAFKRDYFDALVAESGGERIAEPDPELRDPDAWQDWIDDLILQHSEQVEHVGPRTEAVRMLRDFVTRSIAYLDMKDMRDRQGVFLDADGKGEAAADGGTTELRVPIEEIKRICDQIGVSTRALQIELDARGLTLDTKRGVSDAAYVDGTRVGYWSLKSSFADPEEVVKEPSTSAELAREEERTELEDERTTVGAVDEDQDQPNVSASPPSRNPRNDDEDEDYEPGMRDSFGADPDEVNNDD